jgi:hypothetical protein
VQNRLSLSVLCFGLFACGSVATPDGSDSDPDAGQMMNAAGSDAAGTAQHPGKPVSAGAGGGVVGGAAGSAANGGNGGAAGGHVTVHPAAGSGGSTHLTGGAGGASDAAGGVAPAAGSGGTSGNEGGAGGAAGSDSEAAGSDAPAAGSGGAGGGSGGAAGEAAPPPLKYDCPASNADADANGYPDACEQLLWTEEIPDIDGAMVFPLYILQTTGWTPDMVATIIFAFGDETMGDEIGPAAGTFVANGELFTGVNDVETFDASTQYNAKRVAAVLYTSSNGYSEYSNPAAGDLRGFNNSSEPGTQINLHGKHIAYFTRVITGYGFDGSNDQQGHPRNLIGLRGGWRAYGY